MAATPIVSVITATRNRPDLLGRALRSIGAQSFGDFESITVDDGSDADTLEATQRLFDDLDERFVFVPPHAPGAAGSGPGTSRNRGIRRARGEWVAFLDDDDWWVADDHLEVGVRALLNGDADFYFADLIGDRDGTSIDPGWIPDRDGLSRISLPLDGSAVRELPFGSMCQVLKRYLVHPDCLIIKRSLLFEVGGFLERIWPAEDYHLMMRLADRATRFLYRPEPVARYRLPTGNAASLMQSLLFEKLQILFVAHHVRATCRRPEVRRCARARQAWTFRELAAMHLERGFRDEAILYAWQGFCAYISPGSLLALARTLARASFAGHGASAGASLDARPAGRPEAVAPTSPIA